MDERTSPDVDPGEGYVLDEPGFAILRDQLSPGAAVLDIGCGHGNVGAYLAEAGATVDGIEPDAARASAAAGRLHHVCRLPLAEAAASGELRTTYDAVTMIDVVEHLVSPVQALRQASTFLGPDSRLFLFVPNSAHWTFRKRMVKGNWAYEDAGLFDRTHLRFFDVTTAAALGPAAGLVETGRWVTTPGTSVASRFGPRFRPNLFGMHVLFELRKG